MSRDEALHLLAEHTDGLRREFGVAHVSVFGSVARDEVTDTSDIDILVEFEPGVRYGYFVLFDLQERLEELLGRDVDLVTLKGLRPEIRDSVLREAVRAA